MYKNNLQCSYHTSFVMIWLCRAKGPWWNALIHNFSSLCSSIAFLSYLYMRITHREGFFLRITTHWLWNIFIVVILLNESRKYLHNPLCGQKNVITISCAYTCLFRIGELKTLYKVLLDIYTDIMQINIVQPFGLVIQCVPTHQETTIRNDLE